MANEFVNRTKALIYRPLIGCSLKSFPVNIFEFCNHLKVNMPFIKRLFTNVRKNISNEQHNGSITKGL